MIGPQTQVLNAHFHELAHNPRDKWIYGVNIDNGILAMYAFSENVSRTGAGICQDFMTHGVCSFITFTGTEQTLQVVDESEVEDLQVLFHQAEKAWIYYRFHIHNHDTSMEDFEKSQRDYLAACRELADRFNVIHRYNHRIQRGGFHTF